MQDFKELVNNEMTEDTKVLSVRISPDYAFCCGFYEGNTVYLWSENLKDITSVLFNEILTDHLLFVHGNEDDYDNLDNFKDLAKLVDYLITLKDKKEDYKVIQYLKKLKELYNNSFNKDLDYNSYVKILVKLEDYVNNLFIDLELNSYNTPLECRHLEDLHFENFDFNDLKSNFPNFKEELVK